MGASLLALAKSIYYFEQKNRTNCNMSAIIRKNEFTFREDNIWSVKKHLQIINNKPTVTFVFFWLLNDGINDIVFLVSLNNLVFKRYKLQNL